MFFKKLSSVEIYSSLNEIEQNGDRILFILEMDEGDFFCYMENNVISVFRYLEERVLLAVKDAFENKSLDGGLTKVFT